MTTDFLQPWPLYAGKPNTAELLREKAYAVAEVIANVLDSAEVLTRAFPSAEFGERERLLAGAETAAYWLHIVDRYFAFPLLSPSDRDTFNSALIENIAAKLREIGIDRSEFLNLLQARYAEYTAYKEMVETKGESAKGTLNWEFAKKVAAILGVGKNALFNVYLSLMMMRHLERANLAALLKGRP
jgi:hypothetical protein